MPPLYRKIASGLPNSGLSNSRDVERRWAEQPTTPGGTVMLIKIAVVVLVAAAGLAGFVASRPSEFRVARSRTLSAPPDVVFAHVNDFHTWQQWSPWEKFDPAMKRELSGPPAGVGASYAWAGN